MNDVFIERMVKKKMEGKDLAAIFGIALAAMVLSSIGFIVGFTVVGVPTIFVLVLAGSIFGVYKFISLKLLEFEYSLTNGYVAIDKIMNRQSRKRMTSFECDSCEDIGKYAENEQRLKNRSFDTRVFATESSNYQDSWYMIVRGKKTGKTLLVFDPDEDFMDAVKKFIPRQLKFEKFGRG